MTSTPTPRQVRHRLLKMERWLVRNRHRFTLQHQDDLDGLLEVAQTAAHADALEAEIERLVAQDERLQQQITEVSG